MKSQKDINFQSYQEMSFADKKAIKIISWFFERYPAVNKEFMISGSVERFATLTGWLQKKVGWSGKAVSLKEDDISSVFRTLPPDFLLTPASEIVGDFIKNTDGRAQFPTLLLLHFDNEKQKKQVFPRIEVGGYRMLYENDDLVFFFQFQDDFKNLFGPYQVKDRKVQDELRSSLRSLRRLSPDTTVNFISVPARTLLMPRRFDIAIKVQYARLWKSGAAKEWREYIYYEQALRITGPGKSIKEYDGSGKEGMEAFTSSFHSLIAEENTERFPPFVIDKNGVALDGSHRISAAILKNSHVRCVQSDDLSNMYVTADFFKGISHGHESCPAEILDEAAIEYCLHKDTTAIVLVFPAAPSLKPALDELSKIGEIVYQKSFLFSPKAGGVLLRQAYMGQPWLDWSGHKTGFRHKQKSCFPFSGPLRVFLLDNFDPAVLRSAKEKIREAYGLENHSIHITDSSEETLRIARALFNDNSVQVMKRGTGDFDYFHGLLFALRDWMFLNDIDENNVCVDSSAVLSVLGLRECRDLDFLYHGDPNTLPSLPKGVDCHNNQACYYRHSVPDIVGDPRLHFWYMGIKFCSPEVVRDMKISRGERKDLIDVKLLQSALPSRYLRILYKIRTFVINILSLHRARLSILIKKIKTKIRFLLGRVS